MELNTLEHLNALRLEAGKPALKSWKKSKDTLLLAIDELKATIEAANPARPVEEPVIQKSPRGAIGQKVMELLEKTSKSYSEIVDEVRGLYPDAKTTARSIASVAADMRRSGVNIPDRRHKPATA